MFVQNVPCMGRLLRKQPEAAGWVSERLERELSESYERDMRESWETERGMREISEKHESSEKYERGMRLLRPSQKGRDLNVICYFNFSFVEFRISPLFPLSSLCLNFSHICSFLPLSAGLRWLGVKAGAEEAKMNNAFVPTCNQTRTKQMPIKCTYSTW